MAKQMSLEEAISRVEKIAEKLEGDISIDESITLYAEAVKLIEYAGGKLDTARQEVEELSPKPKENQDDGE